LRYNPELITANLGFLWNRPNVNSEFSPQEPTNILDYPTDDVKNIGWYHIPVNKGKASWIMPHQNKSHGGYMISYVIPLYVEGQLIGVVGMGLDFDIFMKELEYVGISETDHIYLLNEDNTIAYHKYLASGTPRPVEEAGRLNYDTLLENGMTLVVSISGEEIYRERDRMVILMAIVCVAIVFASLLLTTYLTNRLIKPLKELTDAAQKMQVDEYHFDFSVHTEDEVGVLSDSFKAAAKHIESNMRKIRELAYVDALTGVKNTTSYNEEVEKIGAAIARGEAKFGLVLFDVNNLKKTNDTLGHSAGDKLLKSSCHLICKTFKHSPVYRIGGDEFIVILRGEDYLKRESLLSLFYEEMPTSVFEHEHQTYRVSIAHGMALYEPTDESYAHVFARADASLYINKAKMKESRELFKI
jgi:diguanylate cyclase (GGDEF)-like protein